MAIILVQCLLSVNKESYIAINMNIVQIHSGLGNQMFQYAFFLALQKYHPDTKIDASIYAYRPSHNGYELERIFGIRPPHATHEERNRLADVSKDIWSVIRRKIGLYRHTTGTLYIEPDPANGWAKEALKQENCYMQGYWQSERYFAEIVQEVKQAFTFPALPKEIEPFANEILQNPNSVSVHIRRGDYLKARRVDDYSVCGTTYYQKALAHIQTQIENPTYYVFSDEPEWGKEQSLFPDNTIYISGHTGKEAYIDMQLMSLCRHHIIANSSFSWWGAWLGQQNKSITIAPNKWFRYRLRPDIIPSQWTTIDVE